MQNFLDNAPNVKIIDSISDVKNQLLFPYYSLFKRVSTGVDAGIFFIDPMGIYVALDDAKYKIVHLERFPFADKPVYAISDFQDCALLQEGRISLYFRGVVEIDNIGFKFIKDDYFIRPLLDLVFDTKKRVILTK